jgi:acetyl esterase/lipase
MAQERASQSATRQRQFMELLRAAPDWVVIALNGGRCSVSGVVLEPRLRFLEKSLKTGGALELDVMREATRALTRVMSPVRREDVDVSEALAPSHAGHFIRVRIYEPQQRAHVSRALVYAHFGGGVVGDLETSDWFCAELAHGARCSLISVEYRLAPEHRFPLGFEDFLDAFAWARGQAERWPIVGVCGDSIGGGFAAACAIERQIEGRTPPDCQVLIYPALDLSRRYPSQDDFADAFPMNAQAAAWFMQQYLHGTEDLRQHRLSPGLFAKVAAKVPTLLVRADYDVLADQATAFRWALHAEGAQVHMLTFDDLCHGFTGMSLVSKRVAQACRRIAAETGALLDGVGDA